MSDFDDYQTFVDNTCDYQDDIYPLLGLVGETGEFMELVKKAWRKGGANWMDEIDKDKVKSELGDILWYLARVTSVMGLDLFDVVEYNMTKLLDRRNNR